MASTKWKLLTPRPFNWAMKLLDSAETGVKTLDDGRLELNIRHDILKGVTPAMLGWWFRNIEGIMEHMGKTYPRYLIWHPIDHIHYEVERRAPDGTAGPGASFRIVEAFGGNPDFLVVGHADIPKNDDTGITLSVRKFAMEIMHLEHTFTPVPEGTLYLSKMYLGTKAVLARFLFNRWLRPRYFSDEMGRAWLKHNVEEVGNFEFFLPALYAKHAGRESKG
jgi:DAPG hydrolase PhiG domain